MERVLGIGGIFFKAKDPKALAAWYAEHLGLPVGPYGFAKFSAKDDPNPGATTVWNPFSEDSTKFSGPVMLNFRVANLDAMLAQLREKGVRLDPEVQDSPFGKFSWCFDPEGNKIELWQPPT